jgi:hypothetical protein
MIKSDKQLYREITEEVKRIVTFDEFSVANNLVSDIEELVKTKNYIKNNAELYNKYRQIIIQLKWIALPLLKKEEILGLFSSHFQRVFDIEYFDLLDKFKQVLLGVIMHENRDNFKQKVKRILEKNQARITSQNLESNLPPTVENWIKSYTSELGIGIVETVKLYQYFTQNKDFNNSSETEKEKLKIIFEFYERLKLSSLSAAGVEEAIPVNTPEFKGQIRDGKIEREDKRLDIKIEKLSELARQAIEGIEDLDEMAGHYKTGSLEREAVEEEISKEDRIKELRTIVDNYKKDSLERKAIEEEIEKLEVRS